MISHVPAIKGPQYGVKATASKLNAKGVSLRGKLDKLSGAMRGSAPEMQKACVKVFVDSVSARK